MSFTMPNTIANESSRDARPIQANFAAITSALNNDYVRADGTISMSGALTLSGDPAAPTQAATKAYVDAAIPVGSIFDFAGAAAPSGFDLCLGQLVNKADNPILWALLGTTYGAASETQFRLPDLQSRFVAGKGTATWSDALGETGGSKDAVNVSHFHTMPSHKHSIDPPSTGTSSDGSHNHSSGLLMAGKAGGFTNKTEASDLGGNRAGDANVSIGNDGSHSHTVDIAAFDSATVDPGDTNSAGVSGTNANLPPYIVLNKIIRLG